MPALSHSTDGRGDARLARVRLMQLVSPAWPVGGFSYSQGLEWAFENGWVDTEESLAEWLDGVLHESLAHLDIPVLARLHAAVAERDLERFGHWSRLLIAARETAELRLEERARARAMAVLLRDTGVLGDTVWLDGAQTCYAAGFALACGSWKVSLEDSAAGYAWSWVENQVAAAIRLLPRLGHTGGARVQMALGARIPAVVGTGLALDDREIGASTPALAIASSRHQFQHTRLFRS